MFKHWAGIPVLILVALALIWGIPYLSGKYRVWQVNNSYEKLSEPYFKDSYGGKTPEETYDLFVDALKDEDIGLASKYFVIEKQDDWLKTLAQLLEKGLLTSYVKEIEQNRANWELKEEDGQRPVFAYSYSRTKPDTTELPISGGKTQKIILPAGVFIGQVIFSKYPNGIWKIELI